MLGYIDQRLIYHELYEKLLYTLTDIDYVSNMDDDKIKKIVNEYSDILSMEEDNLHSLFIYYFYDFYGDYLPLSEADRYNDNYYKALSKIIVLGNIDNFIEMSMEEIVTYFNLLFSYYYDTGISSHVLMYISQECLKQFEYDKEITKKFKIYLMEHKLKK